MNTPKHFACINSITQMQLSDHWKIKHIHHVKEKNYKISNIKKNSYQK